MHAQFLEAVRAEDGARARELLRDHPEIAQSSIHAAAAACDAEAVRQFIEADRALAIADAPPHNVAPLIFASGTPLQLESDAAMVASARCVELLLDAGASANTAVVIDGAEGPASIPALYFTCVHNNSASTKLLLSHGANVNDGESIYHAAEQNSRECLQLLVEHGADISRAHQHWGNTPLYFLSNYKPSNSMCASSELGMAWLLKNGADPNVASLTGERFAHLSTRGELPLHRVASHRKSAEVARMLVEHGAIVDAPRGDGRTAFVLAMRTGNATVGSYLASVGANEQTLAPIDELLAACAAADATRARAIIRANPGIMHTLSLEDERALHNAAEESRLASVQLMASLGWNLAVEGEWGGTALHQAAWFGMPESTRMLLDAGAPVNVRDSTYGSSPIAWAAHGSQNSRRGTEDDYAQIVSMLIDAGATREASYNKWNEAPENMASESVARVLRARGFAA